MCSCVDWDSTMEHYLERAVEICTPSDVMPCYQELTVDALYEVAEREHVQILRAPDGWRGSKSIVGEYVHQMRTIIVSQSLGDRQLRSTLCHELFHYFSGDEPCSSVKVSRYQERECARRTAVQLIDPRRLTAYYYGGQPWQAVARDLDVSMPVVEDFRRLVMERIVATVPAYCDCGKPIMRHSGK